MKLTLNPKSLDDYRTFLQIKSLPSYKVRGRLAEFPDHYAERLNLSPHVASKASYEPSSFCYDYQAAISKVAIDRRKFAVFCDCGLGKTIIMFEFLRHAAAVLGPKKRLLIVCPINVVPQTVAEHRRFYPNDPPIRQLRAHELQAWLDGEGDEQIGITNFEALKKDTSRGLLGALAVDESSILKSAYGTTGRRIIGLGRGLDWKLCLTGTPAPNDRIEFGSHAVFLDMFPNVNSFLAKFFINRGQTSERWALRQHALRPFYRALSHWCIFVTNPATYGWKDNTEAIPPIHTHIHDVPMTGEQRDWMQKLTGSLAAHRVGGIKTRGKLSQIAKGFLGTGKKAKDIATHKYEFIADLVASWPEDSTLIWCWFNEEQDRLNRTFPESASVQGSTSFPKRIELIDDFKARRRSVMISKPDVLGFGLNLQVARRQVFSSLIDSYEKFYQCIKRSNRIGSTHPLNVHLPVCDMEVPMIETVLAKADRVQKDTEEQEALFKDAAF